MGESEGEEAMNKMIKEKGWKQGSAQREKRLHKPTALKTGVCEWLAVYPFVSFK